MAAVLAVLTAAISAVNTLQSARLYRAHSVAPLRRLKLSPSMAADDNDWDASWQRMIAERERQQIEPNRDVPITGDERKSILSEAVDAKFRQAIDVRQWRLPFAWFAFLRNTDLFGTLLGTTMSAWALFYLVVVPMWYATGPALGIPPIAKSSGLIPVDLQMVANAVFIPAWPACLVVAAAWRLRQGNPFAVDEE